MPTSFLTPDQRNAFGRFRGPPAPEELARYFHLDGADLATVRQMRGRTNRLGFAILLCGVRFTGRFIAQSSDVPDEVVVYIANQLDKMVPGNLSEYFDSSAPTYKRHTALIRVRFGYRDFHQARDAGLGLMRRLAAANAMIAAVHSKLPITNHWGDGQVASADGMRFLAPKTAIHAGPNPKYFGRGRGITWYNMLSDQYSGLGAMVVPGTLRDSLAILALLLEQETELDPSQIMTDTGAYSDTIFGLFWLLGYQFCPRLADIGGARLWRVDKTANYGPLGAIAEGTINIKLIIDHWEDLIRLAGSLKLGHLQAQGVMRILQVRDRPTTLAKALMHLGRLIKTLHILNYIDDAEFRRRILVQLNRQEFRHKLARKIYHGDRGEVRNALRQGQEEQLGSLGLALNAVTHWNAVYMQAAIEKLRADGHSIDPADVARLSPILWRHINFLGRYDITLPESVAQGGLRPLRNPTSEWDF